MWGGQWVSEKICDKIEVNLAKGRAETIVRKTTGNHLTHYHPKRKKNWIGHVVRGDGLMELVLEGRVEGNRPRGEARSGRDR